MDISSTDEISGFHLIEEHKITSENPIEHKITSENPMELQTMMEKLDKIINDNQSQNKEQHYVGHNEIAESTNNEVKIQHIRRSKNAQSMSKKEESSEIKEDLPIKVELPIKRQNSLFAKTMAITTQSKNEIVKRNNESIRSTIQSTENDLSDNEEEINEIKNPITMLQKLYFFLTRHLMLANQTYIQHLLDAMKYALISFYAGFALIIHAFFPFMFEFTGSNVLIKMSHEMCEKRKKCGIKCNIH